MFKQLFMAPRLLFLVLFLQLPWALDASFVCESNFLPTCCQSSNSHIILSNPNSLISSKPNNVRPLPETTKNLHLMILSLCFHQTAKCLTVLCLNCYMFLKIIELFSVAHNDSTIVFRNRLLNILNGMRIPSGPESNFWIIFVCFWQVWCYLNLYILPLLHQSPSFGLLALMDGFWSDAPNSASWDIGLPIVSVMT